MDTHEYILKLVQEAREFGRTGNYDLCSKQYNKAKSEIESLIKTCRNRDENTIWNNIIKEIVSEESSIRRIRSIVDEIVKVVNVKDAERQAKLAEAAAKADLPDKPDFVVLSTTRKQNFNLSKRKGLVQAKPPRNNLKGRKNSDIQSPRHGLRNHPNNQKNGNDSNSTAALMQDPFIKQIIDLGILVKDPNVQWESIAGLDSIKRLLRQNLVILPMRPDIARGLLAPWRSVLFYGPPGTGKTFLAKAIATECKRTFFNITSATITSRFLGESEKLVVSIFKIAQKMSPSTIFFDEIDSIASQRGSKGESESARRIKAELLTELEGIGSSESQTSIFVLAATNFPWDLDEALLRRFQKRVYIPLPDFDDRTQLLKMKIADIADENFDFNGFGRKLEGYSCADISSLCSDAAQIVFNQRIEGIDTALWQNMSVDEAQIIITNEVFAQALSKRKSSVDPSTIAKYLEWKQLKGAE